MQGRPGQSALFSQQLINNVRAILNLLHIQYLID